MKMKKLILTIVAILVIAIPATVFAATSTTTTAVSIRNFFGFGVDTSKLTDAQKADVSTYSQKMADVQKEFINKMITNGTLTKEQGTLAINKIDEQLKNGTYAPGINNDCGKRNFGEHQKGKQFGNLGIDISAMTESQKADFKVIYTKMAANNKDLLNKLVAVNLITKAQADLEIKRIDEQLANGTAGFRFEFGFMKFKHLGIDTSKLTNQQKAYFTDHNKKTIELQKELITKAVASGFLTKTQGDTIISKIENMPTDITDFQNNFNKGMRGKGFKGQKNSLENKTTKPL